MTQLNEIARMQQLAGLISESQLNEDNTHVKKIARDLYSWLKQQGVNVKLIASTPSNTASKAIGAQLKGGGNEALIYYWDDSKTNQTAIQIQLTGDQKSVAEVEKNFISAYPGLEQYDRTTGGGGIAGNSNIYTISFRVKEKTTKKGGLVSNTPTNAKPAETPAVAAESLEQAVNEALKAYRNQK